MLHTDNEVQLARESSNGDSKCFFCDCESDLSDFKNFFVCKECIIAASKINEENNI